VGSALPYYFNNGLKFWNDVLRLGDMSRRTTASVQNLSGLNCVCRSTQASPGPASRNTLRLQRSERLFTIVWLVAIVSPKMRCKMSTVRSSNVVFGRCSNSAPPDSPQRNKRCAKFPVRYRCWQKCTEPLTHRHCGAIQARMPSNRLGEPGTSDRP
jgi:hypothetical protein